MSKRIAAIVLAVSFLSLAIAPETLAHRRGDCNRSGYTGYYGSYPSRLVAGRYYAAPYYSGVASRRYYATPYYGTVATRYYGQRYYSTPYYSGVASRRYYAAPYYRSTSRYYDQRYYRGRRSTGNLVLSVAAPAAIGAGVGAIAGGGKGAGIGALVGAGGGALYYLLKHRSRRY
jgi:hypothetical protein